LRLPATHTHTHTHKAGFNILSSSPGNLGRKKKKFEDHIRSLEALSQVLEFLKYSVIILYMTAKC